MAVIEIESVELIAAIDPVFDEDHWICCSLPPGFVGITKTFCGQETMEYDPEYWDSVSCETCTRVLVAEHDYCPINGKCIRKDV